MLVFITSIRHPHNSRSYERIGALLDATLHSMCRQTDDRFKVIIVCNERPRVKVDDRRVEFVDVEFPPPSLERTPDYSARIIDKGAKLAIGVVAAREYSPDHLMFADSDDLVHCRLAEFANGMREVPGWYLDSGYVHTAGTNYVQLMTPDFHLKCGSSSLVRADLVPVPPDLRLDAGKQEVIDVVGLSELVRLLGSHGKWESYLASMGHRMEAMPFPAAVWMIGTGENVSGNLVSSRARSPIGPDITAAFGLTESPRFSTMLSYLRNSVRRAGRRVGR